MILVEPLNRVESNYSLVWWAENILFGLARFGSTKKSLVLVDMPLSVACTLRPSSYCVKLHKTDAILLRNSLHSKVPL